MENLYIQGERGVYFIPNVDFNYQTGVCTIAGESYLEEAFDFYDKLSSWVSEFFDSGRDNMELNFKLTYFNTSSSRAILDFLRVIKNYHQKGKTINITWYYPDPDDDDDMKMEAEDFMDETGLPIKLVQAD